jgi:hypothetical protein
MRRPFALALSALAACGPQGARDAPASPTQAAPQSAGAPAGAPAPPAAPAGFAFKLADVKTEAEGRSAGEPPVLFLQRRAKVVLAYTLGGEEKTVEVEALSLSSQGGLGDGERLELTAAGDLVLPSGARPEDFPEVIRRAIRESRPEGAVASAGFINYGTRSGFRFVLYHLVPLEGRRYRVVSQESASLSAPWRVAKELEL